MLKKYTQKEIHYFYLVCESNLLYPIIDKSFSGTALEKIEKLIGVNGHEVAPRITADIELILGDLELTVELQGFVKSFLAHQVVECLNFLDVAILTDNDKQSILAKI